MPILHFCQFWLICEQLDESAVTYVSLLFVFSSSKSTDVNKPATEILCVLLFSVWIYCDYNIEFVESIDSP